MKSSKKILLVAAAFFSFALIGCEQNTDDSQTENKTDSGTTSGGGSTATEETPILPADRGFTAETEDGNIVKITFVEYRTILNVIFPGDTTKTFECYYKKSGDTFEATSSSVTTSRSSIGTADSLFLKFSYDKPAQKLTILELKCKDKDASEWTDVKLKEEILSSKYTRLSVGDVILKNGAVERYNNETLKTLSFYKDAAIAVVFAKEEGKVLAVGLHNSKEEDTPSDESKGQRMWAPQKTTGYTTDFDGIKSTITSPYDSAKVDDTVTYSGDLDGSDNWAYICSIDPEGAANAAENYPAFAWANNYGKKFGLPELFKDGWYIPTVAEFGKLYGETKKKVDAVMQALDATVLDSFFWTSSQNSKDAVKGYDANISIQNKQPYIYHSVKYNKSYVCCIRAFETVN